MNVRRLSKELQEKAQKELNEDPKRVESDIKHVREWLQQQCHLSANPDDQFILTFLRGCKFNYEVTKQKIDIFFSTKTLIPEYLKNRDPFSSEFQFVLENREYWVPLPKSSDPLAPRVLCQYGQIIQPSKELKAAAIFKVNLSVLDILLHEDDSFILNGYSVIQFMNNFSAKHLSQISLKMIRDIYTCKRKRYPIRVKGFHFVNLPPGAIPVYKMIKPFIPQKLQSRVTFHENDHSFKGLHEVFSKAELPTELGGDAGSFQAVCGTFSYYDYNNSFVREEQGIISIACTHNCQHEWKKKIEEHREWLLEQDQFCSDELKRIKRHSDMFGLEGSFRKLNID